MAHQKKKKKERKKKDIHGLLLLPSKCSTVNPSINPFLTFTQFHSSFRCHSIRILDPTLFLDLSPVPFDWSRFPIIISLDNHMLVAVRRGRKPTYGLKLWIWRVVFGTSSLFASKVLNFRWKIFLGFDQLGVVSCHLDSWVSVTCAFEVKIPSEFSFF